MPTAGKETLIDAAARSAVAQAPILLLRAGASRRGWHSVNSSPFERLSDGTLALRETRRPLRCFLVLAALLLIAVVQFAFIVGVRSNWQFLGGLAGATGMVLIAAVVSDLRVMFNQAAERLTWEQRNWFRTRRVMVAFSDVRDVFVLESVSRDNDDRVGGYAVTYRSMLRTTREPLPLSMIEGPNRPDSQALCDAVREIVMHDAKAPDAQTQVVRMIRAGRLVDAVAMIREQRGVSLAEALRIAEDMRARNEDARPRRPT